LFVRIFGILQHFSRTNEFVHATTQVSKRVAEGANSMHRDFNVDNTSTLLSAMSFW